MRLLPKGMCAAARNLHGRRGPRPEGRGGEGAGGPGGRGPEEVGRTWPPREMLCTARVRAAGCPRVKGSEGGASSSGCRTKAIAAIVAPRNRTLKEGEGDHDSH